MELPLTFLPVTLYSVPSTTGLPETLVSLLRLNTVNDECVPKKRETHPIAWMCQNPTDGLRLQAAVTWCRRENTWSLCVPVKAAGNNLAISKQLTRL